MLRTCWIDTYIRLPDLITHNAGKNFVASKFCQHANSLAISTKSVLLEARWSVGLIERAHPILQRAYEIITEELGGNKELNL